MSSTKRRWFRTAAAAGATVLCAAISAGSLGAYTVITRDGHRIVTKERPEIRGQQVFMRLEPEGQLAVIGEELIDWERTEVANPKPAPIAVPADSDLVGRPDSTQPAPERSLQLKITGKPAPKAPDAPKKAEPSKEPGDVYAQEALIQLKKEYAQLTLAHDRAEERRKLLDAELEGLRSRHVGYAGDDQETVKRMRELQDLIDGERRIISRSEGRLSDIRAEAVQLGGSID